MTDGYSRALDQSSATATTIYYQLKSKHSDWNKIPEAERVAIIHIAGLDCAAMCLVESIREAAQKIADAKAS